MSEFIQFIDILKSKYPFNFRIKEVIEDILNENYGIINILQIDTHVNSDKILFVIPGYSFKSFSKMTSILLDKIYNKKYKTIYIINWGDTIKKISEDITKDILDENEKYKINELFREKMANILNKILRSEDMDLKDTKYSLLGKSAGGGIALYIAALNKSVNKLYLCAPATITNGSMIIERDDLYIKISWNKDDNIIHPDNIDKFISNFTIKNNYKSFLYDEGGHELNPLFVKEL